MLGERLAAVMVRDAHLNTTTTEIPVLVNHIVGVTPEENTRRWIAGARAILDEATSKTTEEARPVFIVKAMEVWHQDALPLAQKSTHIDGISVYFQQALAASLGREEPARIAEPGSVRAAHHRSASSMRMAAVVPRIPLLTRFEWGPLPDDGVSLLKRIESLEFEAPEKVIPGLGHFLEAEPVPMVVVDMSEDIGNILLVNESFRQKFEWTDKGIQKAPLRKLFHIGDAFSLAARIFLIRRKDKAYFDPTSLRFGRGTGSYWRTTGAGIVRLWHGAYYGIGTLTDVKEA